MTRGVHDGRLVPFAVSAAMGSWLGTTGHWEWSPRVGVLVVGALAVAGAVLVWRRVVGLCLMIACVTFILAMLRVDVVHESEPARWAAETHDVSALVRITTETSLRGPTAGRPDLAIARGTMLQIESRAGGIHLRQPVTIFGSTDDVDALMGLVPGATYRVEGRSRATPRGSPEPMTIFIRGDPEQVADPGTLARLVNHLRGGLREAASHSPPDQAALVPSLVVGDTHAVSEELSEQFRTTALAHLLAVSGANLTLMLGVLLTMVRALGVRGWAVRVVTVLGVLLFMVLCRMEESVVRAGAMGLVALVSMGVGTGQRSVRNIALAVTCLMFLDPWLSRSYAFGLSVAACLGISLWATSWVESMTRWAPRWLAEVLCVPLAAQMATTPIIVSLSSQISIVGVLANMAAAPFVGPTTVLGLLAACLSVVPPVATVLAWLAGWCVQPILWIAGFASQLPGAAISWPSNSAGVLTSLVLCLAWAVVVPPLLARRWSTLLLVLVLVVISMVRPGTPGWPGHWDVVFCDVGQGDGTVLRAGDGVAVVVDTGPEPRAILRCLQELGIDHVPLLVLTHYHADHIGGAEAVLERYTPAMVLVSPLASPPHAAAAVGRAARHAGAEVVAALPGQVLEVGRVTWSSLGAWHPSAPVTEERGESATENDASVVGLADVDGLRILLPGDAEPLGQRRAIGAATQHGLALGAHILKLPHHGAAAQDPAFLDASGAALAVVSAGSGNSYGHPAPSALSLAAEHGMVVARTDLQGSLAVSFEDREVRVLPQQ